MAPRVHGLSWPAPTRADHDQFCRTEGWNLVRTATGAETGHHITYELNLPDGRVLRTRVSRPPDRSTYGAAMWKHILRDQLGVDQETFWGCVQAKVLPDRGAPKLPEGTLPVEVARLLRAKVGLSEIEVRAFSRAEAIERLNRYWQEGS